MPAAETQRKIEAAIQEAMNGAVADLRTQLTERLRHSQDEVLAYLKAVDFSKNMPQLPAELLAPPPAPRPEPREVLESLLNPVRAIDAARSQREVLRALLRTSEPFASRAAILLLDEMAVRFWEGRGIDRAAGSSLAGDESGALDSLRLGRGVVTLAGTAAARFGAVLGVAAGAAPSESVLVPIVLRDKIAGALYADRQRDDEAFEPRALQLLTYLVALALETLVFRQREATPSLVPQGEASAAGLRVWSSAKLEAEVAPEPAVETALASPAAEQVAAPHAVTDWTAVPELPSPAEAATPPTSPPELEGSAASLGQGPGPLGVSATAQPAVVSAPPALPAHSPEPTVPVPVPEPAKPTPATAPMDVAEQDTLLLPRRPGFGLPGLPKEPEPAKPPVRSSEVRPPQDLRGPGWAFSQAGSAAPGTVDAQRDEARRLARLLVSEIKLYNEDQVELGRRNSDLYRRLREDIDRSRQMYEDRVAAEVRASSDYFQQELVRILAGGDERALGL